MKLLAERTGSSAPLHVDENTPVFPGLFVASPLKYPQERAALGSPPWNSSPDDFGMCGGHESKTAGKAYSLLPTQSTGAQRPLAASGPPRLLRIGGFGPGDSIEPVLARYHLRLWRNASAIDLTARTAIVASFSPTSSRCSLADPGWIRLRYKRTN